MSEHKRTRSVRWSLVEQAVVGFVIGVAIVLVVGLTLWLTDWMQSR